MVELEVDIVVEQLRRPVPGGIGTYCRGLLQGLRALSEQSPAVRLRASRPARGGDPLLAEGFPVEASRLPGRLLTALWARGLPVGFARRRAPVTHATSFGHPPVAAGLVVMVHDLAWRRFPEAYPAHGRSWHESALRRAARQAARLVVPSELTAGELLGAGLGVEPSRVTVIPEGLDHLAAPDLEAATGFLAARGIEPGSQFLLTVSTLEPRKNLARLVDAYGSIRRQLPEPWPLVVVGPAGWKEGGVAPAPGVVAAGPAAAGTLSGLYHLARLLAYVPLLEGFGLPAGEALSRGTPVVASRGLPSAAGACVEVDPTDTASIAAGLLEAASDDRRRAELVSAGAARAAELTWARAAERHVEVWSEVARA